MHQDFTVTKDVDKATPSLLQGLNEGKVYGDVEILVGRNDAGTILELFKYELEDAVLSSISVGGGGGAKPVETITFNYSKIKWTYSLQKEEGAAGGKAAAQWDVSLNAAE